MKNILTSCHPELLPYRNKGLAVSEKNQLTGFPLYDSYNRSQMSKVSFPQAHVVSYINMKYKNSQQLNIKTKNILKVEEIGETSLTNPKINK